MNNDKANFIGTQPIIFESNIHDLYPKINSEFSLNEYSNSIKNIVANFPIEIQKVLIQNTSQTSLQSDDEEVINQISYALSLESANRNEQEHNISLNNEADSSIKPVPDEEIDYDKTDEWL